MTADRRNTPRATASLQDCPRPVGVYRDDDTLRAKLRPLDLTVSLSRINTLHTEPVSRKRYVAFEVSLSYQRSKLVTLLTVLRDLLHSFVDRAFIHFGAAYVNLNVRTIAKNVSRIWISHTKIWISRYKMFPPCLSTCEIYGPFYQTFFEL